jgi:hypothetical protein
VPKLGIYNPRIWPKGFGTIAFRDAWDIFDQIMVSETLMIIPVIGSGKPEFTTSLFDTNNRTI